MTKQSTGLFVSAAAGSSLRGSAFFSGSESTGIAESVFSLGISSDPSSSAVFTDGSSMTGASSAVFTDGSSMTGAFSDRSRFSCSYKVQTPTAHSRTNKTDKKTVPSGFFCIFFLPDADFTESFFLGLPSRFFFSATI